MNLDPNGCKTFVRRSEMRGTLRQLQQFHEDPGALQRLLHQYTRCDTLLTAAAP